jgi:hypothetical protein
MYVQADQVPWDSHPSAFGHQVVAEAVEGFLREEGLVSGLVSDTKR